MRLLEGSPWSENTPLIKLELPRKGVVIVLSMVTDPSSGVESWGWSIANLRLSIEVAKFKKENYGRFT
jgi:hypothetical protein